MPSARAASTISGEADCLSRRGTRLATRDGCHAAATCRHVCRVLGPYAIQMIDDYFLRRCTRPRLM
jgi:hypothetical protein